MMDPMGGMGGGAPMGGGDPYAGVQERLGYAGWAVLWPFGRKTHSFICFTFLGASAILQSIVVLSAPFVKQMFFVEGVLCSEVSVGDNLWSSQLNMARGVGMLNACKRVASLRIGWLGSCLYDYSTKLSTCDATPAYPLYISNFSLPEARGIETVMDYDGSRPLAAGAAGAFLTFMAVGAHRLLRLRGPFFVAVAATVMTWVAFFIDVALFNGASNNISTKTPILVGNMGPAIGFEGVAAGLVVVGSWFSYSRCVKAELGWPTKNPHPKHPEGAAAGAAGGAPPPMDPMMGGAPPMDPMAGGMGAPPGGDPMMGGAPPAF